MATSGSFTGGRGGGSTGPYLILDWDRIDTDIAGNRSKLRLTLKLKSEYSINFSATKSGSLEGHSFSYSGGFHSPATKTIKTLDLWVNHNSDGTLSRRLDASFDIRITWGSTWVGSVSVSGTANLDRIPRTSDFSISGNTIGSAITVSISRASSSFTHKVIYDLPDGSRRASWDDVATSQSFTPSMGDCQYITNSTKGTAKITVQTYIGSTYIGSKAKTFTIYVPSSVVPTASGLSTSIAGSGRDKTLGKYIMDISKVYASFSASAPYGAKVASSSINIKRQSDGGNSQTINGTSGTTANPVSISGTFIVTATVKDSRGRTASTSRTIAVEAYIPPKITKFDVSRLSSPSTTVTAGITASWSPLGTSNPTDILITSVDNAGVKRTHYTLNDSTAGIINTNQTYTGQSDAASFDFTITVTDSFGKKATATVAVGTSFIELTISKGKGIGVGKVHERGALDIAGSVYLTGELNVDAGSKITMARNSYRDSAGGGGLDANNGDIYGLNGVWFGSTGSDISDNQGEGLLFPRSSTPTDSIDNHQYDNLRVLDGQGLMNGKPVFQPYRVLWEGVYFMRENQRVTLSGDKALNQQANGWILVWSDYNESTSSGDDFNFVYTWIPKTHVDSWDGAGVYASTPNTGESTTTKYIYINNGWIDGNAENDDTGGGRDVVLRRVLGW